MRRNAILAPRHHLLLLLLPLPLLLTLLLLPSSLAADDFPFTSITAVRFIFTAATLPPPSITDLDLEDLPAPDPSPLPFSPVSCVCEGGGEGGEDNELS